MPKTAAWIVALLLLAACSGSAQPAISVPTADPSVVLEGGCAGTKVLSGIAPPPWAQAGFSRLGAVPWALSGSGGAVAYLFAGRLVAGGARSDGTANKVLWVTRYGAPALVAAHLLDTAQPVVEITGQPANGNQLPSIVDLPSSGCWSFEIFSRSATDRISLEVLPAGSSTGARPLDPIPARRP